MTPPVIISSSEKRLPLDGAVLIKILRSTCLSYLLLLLLPWHFKLSIMPLGFQVQCCVNGKSKNYVSFTYSYPSGMGEEVVGDRLGLVFKLLAHSVIFLHWSLCSLDVLNVALLTFFFSLFLLLTFHLLIFLDIFASSPTHKCTFLHSFLWTWPQFVNILPLAHPLFWYNDHLTVKSKARRKLVRPRRRGQQHWSNYVSFSPSIPTLMKSLIVRGKRKVGRGGQVYKTYVVHLSYSLKWTEGAVRIM